MRLLIVEDEGDMAAAVARGLRREGLAVDVAGDGREALAKASLVTYDVVVLDRDLPEVHGDEVCRRLSALDSPPAVLMLTAAGEVTDRVAGLALGADDYLGKPFNPRELLARVQAVLRRRRSVPSAAPEQREPLSFGRFTLDFQTRSLLQEGKPVALSGSEFALLKIFVNNPMRTLTRERLLELLHGPEYDGTDRGIDVQVWRLRRTLEIDPSMPRFIQTVRGRGYVFVPDGEHDARAV
jgi:two-component system phosphate regulon response regulator OmpR